MDVTVPLRKPPKYDITLPQIVKMAEAGSGVDLISRADTAALQVERGIPGRKTQAAGCVTAVGACGARRCVRHRLPAARRRPS